MSQARRRRPPPRGRSPRHRLRRLVGGDRPFVAALVVVAGLMLALAWTPLQNYTAAADRVEDLTISRDRLAEEVASLEDRKDRLNDPGQLELHAREELGLVKPGEIPYVVVTPEPEFAPAEPDLEPGFVHESADDPWWTRLRRAIAHLFTR